MATDKIVKILGFCFLLKAFLSIAHWQKCLLCKCENSNKFFSLFCQQRFLPYKKALFFHLVIATFVLGRRETLAFFQKTWAPTSTIFIIRCVRCCFWSDFTWSKGFVHHPTSLKIFCDYFAWIFKTNIAIFVKYL